MADRILFRYCRIAREGGQTNPGTTFWFPKERFKKNLKVVEEALIKQGSLFGNDFGLADILLVTCLDWALAYEFQLPNDISEYHNRIKSRKAYKKAFEINYKR